VRRKLLPPPVEIGEALRWRWETVGCEEARRMMKPPPRTTPTSEASAVPRRRQPALELPPHVRRVKAKSKFYFYVERHRGTAKATKPIRLPNDPGDPAWWAAYTAALGLPGPRWA